MGKQSLFVKRMTALAAALMFLVASGFTRVEAAAAGNLTPEQTEAVIEDAFGKLAAFDTQGVMSYFADDATLEDPVGTPAVRGKEAITAYVDAFSSHFSQMKIYSIDIKVRGQEAAVTWRFRFKTKTGNVFFLDGVGIFKFNGEGKIESEREFFDLEYFIAQLQG